MKQNTKDIVFTEEEIKYLTNAMAFVIGNLKVYNPDIQDNVLKLFEDTFDILVHSKDNSCSITIEECFICIQSLKFCFQFHQKSGDKEFLQLFFSEYFEINGSINAKLMSIYFDFKKTGYEISKDLYRFSLYMSGNM